MQASLRYSVLLLASALSAGAGLEIEDLGKTYVPDSRPGLHHHLATPEVVCDGNTSVRNIPEEFLEWKGKPEANGYGYFDRNRDLGQVFNVAGSGSVTVTAVVLRTSKGNNAVMKGTPGAPLYLQLFEVRTNNGEQPRLNDNGTPRGTLAKHGYNVRQHRSDDFVEGVEYVPLQRATGGVFPSSIPPTTHHAFRRAKGQVLPEQAGHLRYFRLRLTGDCRWTLQGGKRYAFLLGFEKAGKDRGLALAIESKTHLPDAPAFLRDVNGIPWWGIRREGDGTLPPTMMAVATPPEDPPTLRKLRSESLFKLNHWDTLSPTTDGYPDVDTYHTFQFAIETGREE